MRAPSFQSACTPFNDAFQCYDTGQSRYRCLRTSCKWLKEKLNPACRGYPIEQLAEKSSHLEGAYLLIYGALPTRQQFKHFETEVLRHAPMHADSEQFFRSFRYDAHPMSMLTSAFAMLGSYYSEANPSLKGQTDG